MYNNALYNTRVHIVGACIAFLWLFSLVFPGNTDVSVLAISSSFMLICFGLTFFLLWNQPSVSISSIHLLLLTWLVWITTPIITSYVPSSALFGLFQCSFWVVLCFIYLSNQSSTRLWQYAIYIGWGLGLINALYALYQFLFLHVMPNGFFSGKNTAGAFLMAIILLLSGEYLALPASPSFGKNHQKSTSGLLSSFLALSLFVMIFAMLIVMSRGVLLSFVVVISSLVGLVWKQLSITRLRQLLLIFTVDVVAFLITSQSQILHRIEVLQHEKSRLVIWKGAWHLWQSVHWYGIGIFNFMRYYPAFSLPDDNSTLQYAHNDLLQLLIETGIPGFILLISIGILLIYAFYRYLKTPCPTPHTHIKVVSCFAALVAIFLHSLVDFNFYIIALNIMIGCCFGYLNYVFVEQGALKVWEIKLSRMRKYIGSTLLFLIMLLFFQSSLKLLMLNHYMSKENLALKKQDYTQALKMSDQALAWFDYNEMHSKKADLYMRLAVIEQDPSAKLHWAQNAQFEVNKAKQNNIYYSRPYFQQGLLSSIFFNDPIKAYHSFDTALKTDPHNLLVRLTFAQFLLEQQGDIMHAKHIMESGLKYRLTPKYTKPFLSYLQVVRQRAAA